MTNEAGVPIAAAREGGRSRAEALRAKADA